jgi:hypothetical protein
LRLYVGHGRRYSVKQLSNATGVPDRLIESAMCDPESGDFRPLSNECLLSISSVLGDAFTTEWLRLARQGAFTLPDDEIPSPGELVSDCANDTAEIASIARGGKFDERDERELEGVGLREIDRGMKLVASVGKRRRRRAA